MVVNSYGHNNYTHRAAKCKGLRSAIPDRSVTFVGFTSLASLLTVSRSPLMHALRSCCSSAVFWGREDNTSPHTTCTATACVLWLHTSLATCTWRQHSARHACACTCVDVEDECLQLQFMYCTLPLRSMLGRRYSVRLSLGLLHAQSQSESCLCSHQLRAAQWRVITHAKAVARWLAKPHG